MIVGGKVEQRNAKIWLAILCTVLVVSTLLYLDANDTFSIRLKKITSNRVKGDFIGYLQKTRNKVDDFGIFEPEKKTLSDKSCPILIHNNEILVCEDNKVQNVVWRKTFDGKILSWHIDYSMSNEYLSNIFLIIHENKTNSLVCIREKRPSSKITVEEIKSLYSDVTNDLKKVEKIWLKAIEETKKETPPCYEMLELTYSIPVDAVKIIACRANNTVKQPIVCVQNEKLDLITTIGFDGKMIAAEKLQKPIYFAEGCMMINGRSFKKDTGLIIVGYDGRNIKYYDLIKLPEFIPIATVDTKVDGDVYKSKIKNCDNIIWHQRSQYELSLPYHDGFVVFNGNAFFKVTNGSVKMIVSGKVNFDYSAFFDEYYLVDSKLYSMRNNFEPISIDFDAKFVGCTEYIGPYVVVIIDGNSSVGLIGGNEKNVRWPFSKQSQLVPEIINSATVNMDDPDSEIHFFTDNSVYTLE